MERPLTIVKNGLHVLDRGPDAPAITLELIQEILQEDDMRMVLNPTGCPEIEAQIEARLAAAKKARQAKRNASDH
jgi:hypothetical protein